ncbi:MAG: hypothetical protein LBT46_09795 [Planctomycetaceae bacterium]|jgi:hypothetical protein|nr:hypothetical protein [Planctomycetaceae bacterium]
MRLSLRTLLAFEDNVFSVEQHRQLEQIIPKQIAAAETLSRIRNAVRNPVLGVPGLIDGQEELNANFTAEYIDHQLPPEVQDRFEDYCLSGDKYIAEVASVHQILSNVLGEPARTSRECRQRCYAAKGQETAGKKFAAAKQNTAGCSIFREDGELNFPPAAELSPEELSPEKKEVSRSIKPLFGFLRHFFVTDMKKPSKAGAAAALLFVCLTGGVMFLCNEYRYNRHSSNTSGGSAAVQPYNAEESNEDAEHFEAAAADETPENDVARDTAGGLIGNMLALEVAEADAAETADPFLTQTLLTQTSLAQTLQETVPVSDTADSSADTVVSASGASNVLPPDAQITFQPITKQPDKQKSDSARLEPLPQTAWKETPPPAADDNNSTGSGNALPQRTILQTSGTVPGALPAQSPVLGQLLSTPEPAIVFSAQTSDSQWNLPVLPSELNAEEYLLTAVPFRGTLELAAGYRIELVGDAKMCILPPDQNGTAGIYVDYGRIVIRPLKANVPLRIETEKSQGTVSISGTTSVLFIDTFAEIIPAGNEPAADSIRPKTAQILGFAPNNNETLHYKSAKMPSNFTAANRGSLLLQANGYSFAEIPHLPNWLQLAPLTSAEKRLAEDVRRIFNEVQGNSEAALQRLVREKPAELRALGCRLWGDLGRFDVPLTVSAAKRPEDEAVRQVLALYFNEVMKRDAETVQRFAAAIQSVRKEK